MRENNRGDDRLPILGELRGEVTVVQPMSIKEISQGGAQVETDTPLLIGSIHELRLCLGDQSVVVKGRVVHCRISDLEQDAVRYRAGVEFVSLSEHTQRAIAAFIEAVRTARGYP
jgi:hypothetical protein